MRFGNLLPDEGIVVPLEADGFEAALRRLIEGASSGWEPPPEPDEIEAKAAALASGSEGEIVRASKDVVVVIARTDVPGALSVALGVSRSPIAVPGEADGGATRVIVVALTPKGPTAVKERFLPTLLDRLRPADVGAALLTAGSAADVRAIGALMDVDFRDRLLVEDALTPLKYRIYPDTPLEEVADLVVRRHLHSVPVVGESHEMLGLITAGDLLRELVPAARGSEKSSRHEAPKKSSIQAREIMTRSVMCVSEDLSLLEAASLMVNRDVDQLPVVREGELIGFVQRETVLDRLFG